MRMPFKKNIFYILLLSSSSLFSQGGSIRLAVYSGGSLNFVFNTISDYKTGITYTNWTQLGLEVVDDVALPDYSTWSLTIEADDADADGFLTGSNPINTISFGAIEVQANISSGCASCNVFGSPFVPLSAAPTILADGSSDVDCPCPPGDQIPTNLGITTDQIFITYRCGVPPNRLMGETADYYADDIVFTLEMQP
jgi:hypothetical protein